MYRPWKSQVPDIIDGLVTLLQTATQGQYDFTVRDGPWTAADAADQVLCIGWAGFPTGITRPATQMSEQLGAPAVTSQGTAVGLGPSIEEHALIDCSALSRDGNGNVSAARRLSYTNVATVGAILAPDGAGPHVGGVERFIMGTSTGLHQVQDRRGVLAVVTFSITAISTAQQ